MSESHETREGARTGDARPAPPLVVAFRALLLLLAASAVATAFLLGHWHDRPASEAVRRYVCPMHPDVTSAAPGQCPICRMELEPVQGQGASTTANASTYQTYDFVRRRGFGQEVRAPAWIQSDGAVAALVYRDDLAALTPNERGVFSSSSAGSDDVEVHLLPDAPARWDRSTSRVRFALDPLAKAPLAGEVGWIRLAGKTREVEVIPYSAILQGAEGPYVLVASPEGHILSKRMIEIGKVVGGQAIVLSGLRLQERILVGSAFFVDAERRTRRQASLELTP